MTGGPTAPEFVVVHRGQVVVYERIGVNQLEGAGRSDEAFCARAESFSRGEDERGAQSLRGREQAPAYRRVNRRRLHSLRRNQFVELRLDERAHALDVGARFVG